MVQFLFHMTPAGKQWLVDAAAVRGEKQAQTLRAMFSFASRFMPTKWAPDDDPVYPPDTEPDRAMINPIAALPILEAGRRQRADRRNGKLG